MDRLIVAVLRFLFSTGLVMKKSCNLWLSAIGAPVASIEKAIKSVCSARKTKTTKNVKIFIKFELQIIQK